MKKKLEGDKRDGKAPGRGEAAKEREERIFHCRAAFLATLGVGGAGERSAASSHSRLRGYERYETKPNRKI